MPGRECYHCHEWIEDGELHACSPTTEANLTRELSEELKDAWERLRETATEFGGQRIYASHNSIMFSRNICYFFVRPKKKYLEVWFFLGRTLKNPLIRQTLQSSKRKIAHHVRIIHRDQVEAPITDWLKEAYDVSDSISTPAKPKAKNSVLRTKPKGTRKHI